MLEIRILGPLEVVDGDATVPVRGRRRMALLAGLAVSPEMVASRDRLAEVVWPDDAPRDPVPGFRVFPTHQRDPQCLQASVLGPRGVV